MKVSPCPSDVYCNTHNSHILEHNLFTTITAAAAAAAAVTTTTTTTTTTTNNNNKSKVFPSQMGHGAALISVSLALSQIPAYILRDYGYGASVSCTHCIGTHCLAQRGMARLS